MGIEPNFAKSTVAPLDDIRADYERGAYLSAFRRSQAIAPLATWRGAEARILASRLAGNLGAMRLADWHVIRAYRETPDHAEAMWYFANFLSRVRGPLRAWRFLNSRELSADATPAQTSHWYSLKGRVLGFLRDFDGAEEWFAKAQALGWQSWTDMEIAGVLLFEDRVSEAEDLVRRTLDRRPWYRPAVQWLAHFLVQRERDDEAVALLEEGCRRLEAGALWLQYHLLLRELGRFDDAQHALDQYVNHSPLLETVALESLAGTQADIAYWRGDWPSAKRHADRALELCEASKRSRKDEHPFHRHFAMALEQPRPPRTGIELPVPFVRQNYETCAPATLAAIYRFWGQDVDHLETAEAITYRGTTQGKERQWAEKTGFVAKEFTVTWDAAVALLDRGIPFALTTPEITSSHMQAMIGYDSVRRSFWIRDPGERHKREFFADTFFDRYEATGPRGMALVPADRAELLNALSLPDEELHERRYRVEIALDEHRRADAEAEVIALEAAHPDHLVTWTARRHLEGYDGDVPGMLAVTEKTLARYPRDPRSLLAKVSFLRELGSRDDRLALLKSLAEDKKSEPACWQQYAQELSEDAREHVRARLYLTKAIRYSPMDSIGYSALARLSWDQRNFEEAFELDRFAFCLEQKDELLARNFFSSARTLGRTEEALAVLRKRFERFGGKSMLPARTLYFALLELERVDEAMATLQRALELRPSDGNLIAFAGESYMARGDLAKTREYLNRAKGMCQPGLWLRYSAGLARQENDLPRCRDLWRQLLDIEPLANDAHRGLVQTVAEIEGRTAALAEIERLSERFPHNFQLAQLRLEWLRDEPAPVRETAIRRLIELHPSSAWARREYAIVLCEQGQFGDAKAQADLAATLEPKNPSLWTTRFYIHSTMGDLVQAKNDAQQAVRMSVDLEIAQQDLLFLCDTLAERREALEFIESELIRQVTFGQGLLFFRDLAQGTLEQEELLASLEKGLAARPDLWHAWSALIRQLSLMGRYDDALPRAHQAVERFPHRPELWLDLAAVHRGRDDASAELDALTRAVAISPSWSPGQLALASAYERADRLADARAVFESAIARNPLVAQNHVALAEFVARRESKENAIEIAQRAVQLEPGHVSAWNNYLSWSAQTKTIEKAVDFARQLIEQRPGEARAWMRWAHALSSRPIDPDPAKDRANVDAILRAYDEALRRNPRLLDAYDFKATLLAEVTRYDEALEVCRPVVYGDRPPVPLLGRAAWILARKGDTPAAITAMREVLNRDRNYVFGWTNLADWLQSQGRWQEYLEAAENMVRVNPANVVGLAYCGEAKLRLGRRDEGLADLARARRISPHYAFAGILLFEEHFAAGELDLARDDLAQLSKHVPGDEVTARELQLAVRSNDKNQALAILHKLGRADGEAGGPLESAVRTLEAAGWRDETLDALRQLAADRQSHPFAAILLCERTPVDSPDFDNNLRWLDQSIARLGQKMRAMDLKAELLAAAGRHSEALEVCKAPTSPEAVLPLRGRAAWIKYQRGDHAKAIKSMKAVLAESPLYYWGWSQLAIWAEAQGDHETHLEAAERLIQMAPRDPLAFVERSRALNNLGRIDEAFADHRHAVELNPGNTALGLDLIERYLSRGPAGLNEARTTLELIAPFLAPEVADDRRRLIDYLGQPLWKRILMVCTFTGPKLTDVNRRDQSAGFGVIAVLAILALTVMRLLLNRTP
jgi:tetratricopeptide (TPR) repeat protein